MRSTFIALLVPFTVSAADWRTPAEIDEFRTTPRYAETIAWVERLDTDSKHVALRSFGTSPQGRSMKYVVLAEDDAITPEAAHADGKAVVLVIAGIHSGEIEGKDAGMALVRDVARDAKRRRVLDDVVLLFVPVYNVDGHENARAKTRINQNGPAEKGTRGTAQNLNLNRDFLKTDAPETRALLALWSAWNPDLFVDVHTTDGADYQYDLTWYLEEWANLHPAVRAWQQDALIGRAFAATEKRGHLLAPYLDLVDHRDITKGFRNFGSGPRYSTGYAAIRNRPGLLVETHMLKPYTTRVDATYDLLDEILREVAARPDALTAAVAKADRETAARAAGTSVPLVMLPSGRVEQFELKGVAFTQTPSDVSGDVWTTYHPDRKKTWTVPFVRELTATASATVPAAYVVPAAWADRVTALLDVHGVHYERLTHARSVRGERYRLRKPVWASAPFEGRIALTSFDKSVEKTTAVTLQPGDVWVPLDDPLANVAMHLLEPDAPDSLLRWGEFNAIFEQREYADQRVAEQLARDMMAKDPALKAEFEQRVKEDDAFAKDPDARLGFFFGRSEWIDPDLGLYPVIRVLPERID